MRFEVLGPLRAAVEGEPLSLGSRQQQKLLALLLVAANQPVSIDRLIDEIWGDTPPPSARHLIQVYVSRLRSLFGDRSRIVHDAPGYMLPRRIR